MGCCLSCLEHRVWLRHYHKAVRKASNVEHLMNSETVDYFLLKMDEIKPKDIIPLYQGRKLFAFQCISTRNERFIFQI